MGASMLLRVFYCASAVAALSDAISDNAGSRWNGNLRTQAHEIGLLKARNKALVDQISNLTKSHQADNRALLYRLEKLRPRAEFAEAAQTEVLQLRANARARDQTEAALVAQLRQKTELLRSTNQTVQSMEKELRQLHTLDQDHTRMYSELIDEKRRTEDQMKLQVRQKEREIREMRLFKKPKFEHKSPSFTEMGGYSEHATIGTTNAANSKVAAILANPHGHRTQKEKDGHSQDRILNELSSAKGGRVVQLFKSTGLQNKAMDHSSKSNRSFVRTRRQEKEKDQKKGEQRAKLLREMFVHGDVGKNKKTTPVPKPISIDEILPNGFKWLSEVYKNKTLKVAPAAI